MQAGHHHEFRRQERQPVFGEQAPPLLRQRPGGCALDSQSGSVDVRVYEPRAVRKGEAGLAAAHVHVQPHGRVEEADHVHVRRGALKHLWYVVEVHHRAPCSCRVAGKNHGVARTLMAAAEAMPCN